MEPDFHAVITVQMHSAEEAQAAAVGPTGAEEMTSVYEGKKTRAIGNEAVVLNPPGYCRCLTALPHGPKWHTDSKWQDEHAKNKEPACKRVRCLGCERSVLQLHGQPCSYSNDLTGSVDD